MQCSWTKTACLWVSRGTNGMNQSFLKRLKSFVWTEKRRVWEWRAACYHQPCSLRPSDQWLGAHQTKYIFCSSSGPRTLMLASFCYVNAWQVYRFSCWERRCHFQVRLLLKVCVDSRRFVCLWTILRANRIQMKPEILYPRVQSLRMSQWHQPISGTQEAVRDE
jgi:hypothetical protein